MPNSSKFSPDSRPPTVVGDNSETDEYSLEHDRTLDRNVEQYVIRWKTGFQTVKIRSEEEFEETQRKKRFAKVKKAHKPGRERYERIAYEPIRI